MPNIVSEQQSLGWNFDNSYARLPKIFFEPALPKRARQPKVAMLNQTLGRELGLALEKLPIEEAAALFSGQVLPEGSQPIAQGYAGHQYGHFTMLGDGRAILLGEHRTPSGKVVDIQLKGAGPTSYSRRGDGLAALGPMLREYIISEAMFALGIPTTRSLAVVTTGDSVYRGSELRGAVLTRVAASHIRVGTFQYLGARQEPENLRLLADYTTQRHYPELTDSTNKYERFLRAVIARQADLVTRWQMVGFIHGVMNTDNMAISGETIDYGPCAFMNAFRTQTVFSSIDHGGRYAYRNQPAITQWNLARFAEAILPLLNENEDEAIRIATEALNDFVPRYQANWLTGFRKKIGLQSDHAGDQELIQSLLDWMEASGADFTNTFRDLAEGTLTAGLYRDAGFLAWQTRWQQRLSQEETSASQAAALMQSVNPAVIPRNHRVEEALEAAEDRDDLSVLHRLLAALLSPYKSTTDPYYREPSPDDATYQTFCGT